MKKVEIKSIVLKNFKGQSREASFSGEKVVICGRNGVGKSTLLKSFLWCLSGYTEPGLVKNHELFDNREVLSKDTPAASVRVNLTIDGVDVSIERIAISEWKRRRGSQEYEKSPSDKYTILVDDVEITATNYSVWIEKNFGCPIDMFIFLLSGGFMVNLIETDKNKSRKVLQNIIGAIDKQDFKSDYGSVMNLIDKFGTTQAIESLKKELNPIKDEMFRLEGGIATLEEELAGYDNESEEALNTKKRGLEALINNINASIAEANSALTPAINERNKLLIAMGEFQTKLSNKKYEYEHKKSEEIENLRKKRGEITLKNSEISIANESKLMKKKALESRLCDLNVILEELTNKRSTFLTLRDEVLAKVFVEERCSFCGQKLPDEMILDAKERFETQKNSELLNIVTLGKNNSARMKEVLNEIESIKNELSNGDWSLTELYDTSEIDMKISQETVVVPFEQTDEFLNIKNEMSGIVIPELPVINVDEQENEKANIQKEINEINVRLGKIDGLKQLKKSIESKNINLKNLSLRMAEIEQKIDKIKRYEYERANIIGDRINNKLFKSKIEMFRVQKDGSIVDDCVFCQKDGTKYSTSNNGMRIIMQTELQKLFCEFYDIAMPIFVDEAKILDEDKLFFYAGYQTILLMREDCDLTIK